MVEIPRKVKVGKEYELSFRLSNVGRYAQNRYGTGKALDGSGPYELCIPPSTLESMDWLLYENVLYTFLDNSLFDYYVDGGDEQKGNHFHFSLGLGYRGWVPFVAVYTVVAHAYRKLFTVNSEFRNSAERWNEYVFCSFPVNWEWGGYIDDEKFEKYLNYIRRWESRDYTFVTFNRHRKRSMTIEVRISESSIIFDVLSLIVALHWYKKLLGAGYDEYAGLKDLAVLSGIRPRLGDLEYVSYVSSETADLWGNFLELGRSGVGSRGALVGKVVYFPSLSEQVRGIERTMREYLGAKIVGSDQLKEVYIYNVLRWVRGYGSRMSTIATIHRDIAGLYRKDSGRILGALRKMYLHLNGFDVEVR